MTNDDKDLNPAINTDQTIYRQPTTDYGPEDGNDKGMEPSVFVTKEGAVGFNHYGKCVVKPIKEWVEMAWNTPQQPSEPLKELDEKAILMVLDQCCPVSMDKMAKEMIAQILWNKFGQPSEHIPLNNRPYNPVPSFAKGIKDALDQPSEKKVLSVEDMKKIMWDLENKLGYQPAYETIAQAIFAALPAQRDIPLDNQQAYEWGYADGKAAQREVRYPEKMEEERFYCEDGDIYRGREWNEAIDEMKKLNGG